MLSGYVLLHPRFYPQAAVPIATWISEGGVRLTMYILPSPGVPAPASQHATKVQQEHIGRKKTTAKRKSPDPSHWRQDNFKMTYKPPGKTNHVFELMDYNQLTICTAVKL
jgi:hypothetical protein